jgi:transcriptional regulator with XRE-family HTH domain
MSLQTCNTLYGRNVYLLVMKSADIRVRDNLKKLLKKRKLSLDKAQIKHGIQKSQLSRILTGKISPRVVTLQMLADYLGVDPSYFLKP